MKRGNDPDLVEVRGASRGFTDRAARKETGAWWRRELLGLYCPILTTQ